VAEPTVNSGLWRWRGLLIVAALALVAWGLQWLLLRIIAGNGLVLVPLALIGAVTLGVFYGRWAVRSSGTTDPSQNAFFGGLEMPLRRRWASRYVGQAEVWYRWAMASRYPDQALAFLQEAAQRNHPEALFEYGLYLAEGGLGVGGRVSARDYFRRAAEQGHSESAFQFAEMIRWGEGATRNGQEAHRWYVQSAKRGFAPAMVWLVTAFENGEGTERNSEQAAVWRDRLGQVEVIPSLRRSLLNRIQTGEHGSAQRVWQELRSAWDDFFVSLAASSAFPWLLVVGGVLLLLLLVLFAYVWGITMLATPVWQPIFATLGLSLVGMGLVAMRCRKGMRYGWRTRRQDSAAARGDTEACFRVGLDYLRGTHEKPKDPVTAKQWLRQAAEAGHVEAMYLMGDLLSWTIAGPRNPGEAATWFQKAADAGHAGAKARLESRTTASDSMD